MLPLPALPIALLLALQAPSPLEPARCPDGALEGGQSADLWCVDLLPTGHAPGARGVARLAPAPSPFGISVAPDGTARYAVSNRKPTFRTTW